MVVDDPTPGLQVKVDGDEVESMNRAAGLETRDSLWSRAESGVVRGVLLVFSGGVLQGKVVPAPAWSRMEPHGEEKFPAKAMQELMLVEGQSRPLRVGTTMVVSGRMFMAILAQCAENGMRLANGRVPVGAGARAVPAALSDKAHRNDNPWGCACTNAG